MLNTNCMKTRRKKSCQIVSVLYLEKVRQSTMHPPEGSDTLSRSKPYVKTME